MNTGEHPAKADHTVEDTRSSRQGILWLLLAMAVGTGVRGYYLSQPMRYDEAFSFLNFVHRGFPALFFYPLPNNHVLHSILVKAVTQVWGNSPASIRFTAFLAGIATMPLLFCLCRRLGKSGILQRRRFSVSHSLFRQCQGLFTHCALLTRPCLHWGQDSKETFADRGRNSLPDRSPGYDGNTDHAVSHCWHILLAGLPAPHR